MKIQNRAKYVLLDLRTIDGKLVHKTAQ